MELGNFSISLTVKDLDASLAFYKKLGFTHAGPGGEARWAIMRNGDTKVGLFEGMFDANIMTFNPGWNSNAEALERFEDIREIQAKLKADGVELATETDPDGVGPAHIIFTDPDGNTIMLDQHVAKPG